MITNEKVIGKVCPTCEGVHSTSKKYDKLSIVNSGTNSYISKKAVPTGIDITNDEYWQPFGATYIYNGIYKLPGSLDNITTSSTDTDLTNNIGDYNTLKNNINNIIVDGSTILNVEIGQGIDGSGVIISKINIKEYSITKVTYYLKITVASMVWANVTNITTQNLIVIDEQLDTNSNNAIQNDEVSKLINKVITIQNE